MLRLAAIDSIQPTILPLIRSGRQLSGEKLPSMPMEHDGRI
jgi:hypothetical protein